MVANATAFGVESEYRVASAWLRSQGPSAARPTDTQPSAARSATANSGPPDQSHARMPRPLDSQGAAVPPSRRVPAAFWTAPVASPAGLVRAPVGDTRRP